MLVMSREDRRRPVQYCRELLKERDESVLVGQWVRRDEGQGITRAKSESPGPMIEGDHADAGPAERSDRAEPVHPSDLADHGRRKRTVEDVIGDRAQPLRLRLEKSRHDAS